MVQRVTAQAERQQKGRQVSSSTHRPSSFRAAIVGGGYAGLAAAIELASHGIRVKVYEAGAMLGGRARRISHQNTDLDNGAHILLGAYRETLRLMRTAGVSEAALLRLPLRLTVKDRMELRAPRLPAPLHLLIGLLTASGFTLGERWAAIRFMSAMRRRAFRLDRDTTVAALLAAHGQRGGLTRLLWYPLCVAALNTPPERASAQVFLNVLRDGLNQGATDSDLLLPRLDLSGLFPDAAAACVRQKGGEVATLAPVHAIECKAQGFVVTLKDRVEEAEAVICATGPLQASRLLAPVHGMADAVALIEEFSYEPICTVYLQYASDVVLPVPMLGLPDGLIQWLFDRQALYGQRGLLAAVMSASGAHQMLDNESLATTIGTEIAAHFPGFGKPVWTKVIMEKFATFACTPDLQRPTQQTSVRNLYLAGDYTAGEYPATLEGAVRSGVKCARMLIAEAE